jgi:hypothetical protein
VLGRVENSRERPQGGVGDLDVHGGLSCGLVPQDLQVEGGEQAGLCGRVQAGQDVPGQRQVIQQGWVCGLGDDRLEGVHLGFDLFAFVVELGEPVGDPGPHRGRGGVGRVRGELFQAEDLSFLGGVDLLEPDAQGSQLGVPVRGRVGVGGGELGGEQFGAAGAEHMLGEEQRHDLVQPDLRGLDGPGVIGVVGGVLEPGGGVRALVVHQCAGAVGLAAHPAAAVPAPDPPPVDIGPRGGRMLGQPGAVPAGAVLEPDVLGGVPGVPVDDGRVGQLR